MTGSKIKAWVAGTVVLSLLIVVGAWFLLVSPKLLEAEDVRTANEDALSQQVLLRQKLATLKEQSENLDTYRTELAALRTQIPTDGELTDFLRQVQAIATSNGVTVVAMAPGIPEVPAVPVPVAPAPVEGGDAAATEGDAAAATAPADGAATDAAATDGTVDPATAAPAPGAGVLHVPMSITVIGPYANVSAFLTVLQATGPRLMLVTSMSTTALDTAEATGGRPATAPGDVEAMVDGRIYVLPPKEQVTPAVEEPVEGETPVEPETPAPLPSSTRNMFTRVTG